jgi:hypothetical protein
MLIGLVGPSSVGKGVVSDHLRARHGAIYMHIAAPLKQSMLAYGFQDAEVNGPLRDLPCSLVRGMTPRALMEGFGKAITDLCPWLYADLWERDFERISPDRHCVVDGIRRPEEADALRARGGVIVRIDDGGAGDPNKPMDKVQWTVIEDYALPNLSTKAALAMAVDDLTAMAWGL